MIITKLYSSDDGFFDPIEFNEGFNIILGERSEGSEKRNGVGKSISIEFINFGLLKDFNQSRLKYLPKKIIEESSPIFLDLEVYGKRVTIKRELKNSDVVVIYDGIRCLTLNIDDARKYLLSKLQFKNRNLFGSFRSMVNPLTRDERCEFKSIPGYFDTNLKIPFDYKPHFFFLGLDNEPLSTAMLLKQEINSETQSKRKTTNQVETLLGTKIKEAKSEYNKLKEERDVLQNIVEQGDCKAFDIFDEESQAIDQELRKIRIKLASLRVKVEQAKKIINDEMVDTDSIRVLYEKIKSGLGDSVVRNIDEVLEFKRKVNSYTNNIANKKVDSFNKEILSLKTRRDFLISERDRFSICHNSKDHEYDFKEVVGKLAIKNELVSELNGCLKRIEEIETSIKKKKIDLDSEKLNIEILVNEYYYIVDSFESFLLKMHNYIFDDYSASFNITVNNRSEIVEFDLRIKEDGGHSNERAKVFMYDFSLLMHNIEYSNHLGFLIHDNIFDNDNDTLQKSLNFIEKTLNYEGVGRQYILTLNSDKLIGLNLDFDIDDCIKASFTKDSKFLKRDYKEIK
ncbi:TPA: DUF2326 domain-containing protein [Vibrio harveyi]|nr:DUF2326 domain-containing protein [Vibrio harveyi]